MNLVQPSVRGKLRRLQTAIKARLAGEGVAWLILSLIATVFVTLALDYFLRLPRGVRAVFSLGSLALALYVLGRYTIVPLMVPLDSENLALLVERRFGQLKDRLISAIQFSRMPIESTFASQAMIDHMAAEANELAEKIDFKGVVERRTMIHAMGYSAMGVVFLAVFTLWQPDIMSLWWGRNVLLGNTPWPQDTYLSVPIHVIAPGGCNPNVAGDYYYRTDWNGNRLYVTDDYSLSAGAGGWRIAAASIPPDERSESLFTHNVFEGKYEPATSKATGAPLVSAVYKVLRGDNLTVKILADMNGRHVAPEEITVYTRYPSLADTTQEKVSQGTVEEKKNGKWMTYTKSYSVVNEGFTFWVTGGDDSTDNDHRHTVVVIDPPSVMNAKFHVEYPGYVNMPPAEFKGTQGGLAVRVGSKITVTAVTNKDIQSAYMTYNAKGAGSMEQVQKGELRVWMGTFSVGTENKAAVGSLLIHLRDTEGYENNRPQQYLVQVQPDLPPTVDVKVRGVGSRVSRRAIIPLLISAKDDTGIAKVTAMVTVTRAAPASQPASAAATAPLAAGSFAPLVINVPGPDPGHNPKEFKEVRANIDLLDGFHDAHDSAKPGLVPGDKVTVVVTVCDNMPAEFGAKDATGAFVPGPNKVQSAELEFQVVKDEDLAEEFYTRMSTELLDLMEIIKTQSDANTATASASGAADSSVSAQAKGHLTDSQRLQVQVSADSAKVVTAVAGVDEEEINNRIGTPPEREKVKKILDLYRATQGVITAQVAALNALGQVSDAAKFRQDAQTIMTAQQDISRQLEEIKALFEDNVNQRYFATQAKMLIDWSVELQTTLEHMRDEDLNNTDAPRVVEPKKDQKQP
jgi:hypothetical protein